MKKFVLMFVALIMMACSMVIADEVVESTRTGNRFVNEIKQWDFSLGGLAYLVESDSFYYSAGIRRDLGGYFKWLSDDRVSFDTGYLSDGMKDHYWHAGLSINANYVVQTGLSIVNRSLGASFKTPQILDDVLASAGVIGAKSIESGLNMKTGYDYGVNLSVIKTW